MPIAFSATSALGKMPSTPTTTPSRLVFGKAHEQGPGTALELRMVALPGLLDPVGTMLPPPPTALPRATVKIRPFPDWIMELLFSTFVTASHLSAIYTFPWLMAQKGLAGHVLGGWQANTILQIHGGFPWTPYCTIFSGVQDCDFNLDGVSNDRPNSRPLAITPSTRAMPPLKLTTRTPT